MRLRVMGPQGQIEKREYFTVQYGFDGSQATRIERLEGNTIVSQGDQSQGAVVATSSPLAHRVAGDAPPEADQGDGPQFALVMELTETALEPTMALFDDLFEKEWQLAEQAPPQVERQLSGLLGRIAR